MNALVIGLLSIFGAGGSLLLFVLLRSERYDRANDALYGIPRPLRRKRSAAPDKVEPTDVDDSADYCAVEGAGMVRR